MKETKSYSKNFNLSSYRMVTPLTEAKEAVGGDVWGLGMGQQDLGLREIKLETSLTKRCAVTKKE